VYRSTLKIVGLTMLLSSVSHANEVDGIAVVDEVETPVKRSHDGYRQFNDGEFISLYTESGRYKYHLGEDWNYRETNDYGFPIVAAAGGEITIVDDSSKVPSIGKVLGIHSVLGSGHEFYSYYEHMSKLKRTRGQVDAGETIAYVGDADGLYSAHLHYDVRYDKNSPGIYGNPYSPDKAKRGMMILSEAANFLDPALLRDDFGDLKTVSLKGWRWNSFTVSRDASLDKAYVSFRGECYTVEEAIEMNLVYEHFYWRNDGDTRFWKYITKKAQDERLKYFESDKQDYWLYAYLDGVKFHFYEHNHGQLKNRAFQDMLRDSIDAGFTHCNPGTLKLYNETKGWLYYRMDLTSAAIGSKAGRTYCLIEKENPLVRQVWVLDLVKNQWKINRRNQPVEKLQYNF